MKIEDILTPDMLLELHRNGFSVIPFDKHMEFKNGGVAN